MHLLYHYLHSLLRLSIFYLSLHPLALLVDDHKRVCVAVIPTLLTPKAFQSVLCLTRQP
jgi:hypothetical protein